MSDTAHVNLGLVHEYLAALGRGEVGDALARFFTDDAIQVEFPNRLNPNGQQSDLATPLARSIQGQRVLSGQRFEILNELAQGERVAVEAQWTGTIAVAIGTLASGSEMRANFAMFLNSAKVGSPDSTTTIAFCLGNVSFSPPTPFEHPSEVR